MRLRFFSRGHRDPSEAGRSFPVSRCLRGPGVFLFLALALVMVAVTGCAKSSTSAGSVMRQGARTYKAECANCHGTTGSRIPTAPLDSADFLATRGDATLIANVNEGKGTMPAFGKGRGGPLGDEQVRSVVAFLNAQAGRSSVTELASAGEKLYMGNCARCHGEQGNRIPIAPLNAKGFLDTKTDADLVKIISEGQGIMPGLAKDRSGPLSDRDITAVVSYLRYVVEAQVARTVSRGREIYVGQCLMCH